MRIRPADRSNGRPRRVAGLHPRAGPSSVGPRAASGRAPRRARPESGQRRRANAERRRGRAATSRPMASSALAASSRSAGVPEPRRATSEAASGAIARTRVIREARQAADHRRKPLTLEDWRGRGSFKAMGCRGSQNGPWRASARSHDSGVPPAPASSRFAAGSCPPRPVVDPRRGSVGSGGLAGCSS